MALKPIDQQVVVIMGATSGIGLDTARHFAKRGAQLFISGRSEDDLRKVTEELNMQGGQVSYLPADTADWVQVKAVADQAAATYGRIDTWVHVAAVSLYATVEDTTPDEVKQVIDVNLNGQIYGAMAALPYIKREGRGALIHIGSIESRIGLPYQAAYAASKHGIAGFLKSLRSELLNDGYKDIAVTLVMPASTNTPFFNKARTKLGVQPAPVPPVYRADEVADSIIYAAGHKVRTIKVGGAGFMIDLVGRISPPLAENMLRKPAARMQRSDQVKLSTAPDNLFEHLSGYSTVEGDYSDMERPSIYSWFRRRPVIRYALMGSLLAATSAMVVRSVRNGKQRKVLGVIPVTGSKRGILSRIKAMRMPWKKRKFLGLINLAPVAAWASSLPMIKRRRAKFMSKMELPGRRMMKVKAKA